MVRHVGTALKVRAKYFYWSTTEVHILSPICNMSIIPHYYSLIKVLATDHFLIYFELSPWVDQFHNKLILRHLENLLMRFIS